MLVQTSADGHSLLTLLALAAWTTFRAFKEASWCIGCVWKWDMVYLPPSYGHFHREHDDESILKGRIHLSWMVLSFKFISGGIKIINMTNVETYVRIPSVMKCSWWCGRLGPHQYMQCRSSWGFQLLLQLKQGNTTSWNHEMIRTMKWYEPKGLGTFMILRCHPNKLPCSWCHISLANPELPTSLQRPDPNQKKN